MQSADGLARIVLHRIGHGDQPQPPILGGKEQRRLALTSDAFGGRGDGLRRADSLREEGQAAARNPPPIDHRRQSLAGNHLEGLRRVGLHAARFGVGRYSPRQRVLTLHL